MNLYIFVKMGKCGVTFKVLHELCIIYFTSKIMKSQRKCPFFLASQNGKNQTKHIFKVKLKGFLTNLKAISRGYLLHVL